MPAESSWADHENKKNGRAAFIIPSNIMKGIAFDIFTNSSLLMNIGPNKSAASNSLIETRCDGGISSTTILVNI